MRNDIYTVRGKRMYQCKRCRKWFRRGRVLDMENEREIIYFVCKRCFVDKVSQTIQNVAENESWCIE